jgi:predicted helicase
LTPKDLTYLRTIKTFKQLVEYLRDELDWPIDTDKFDDLTFDYAADELGLDSKTAVKVKEIKQLRPLTSKQPWGIFFVSFEPKRLPVVALRRILSTLILKKRQSANKGQQAAWRLHDLLFISSYGEADHRDITFAHFSEEGAAGDLPTLRVLGWDDEDTKLHVDHVDRVLREKLQWPDNESDLDSWRVRWSSAFTLRHREVITTSKALAERLADLARSIRKRANAVMGVESEKGPLRKLHAAFREALIHDLSEDDFADMYAQTIAYGLLTARVSRPAGLVADNLADMVPVTNPFLKDLLDSFLTVGGRKGQVDFDELGVTEVVQLLRNADMEAVLRDFGDRNPEEDPAIHFYELFLKEYDPEKRMQRGVFYTPRPVVSFIVRSVHELLQSDFGLEDGLASTVTWAEMAKRLKNVKIPEGLASDSPFVQILDPATGTATFLVEVIDVIHRTLVKKWKKQLLNEAQQRAAWNDYVPRHLLPRVHGYELMMAPYAIAHMKIGLKLYETGYRFNSNERARIYLTNSLEPATDHKKQREFEEWAPALAHEANAVNAIKRHQRFTVVIGNPPYSNFGQLNKNEFILDLLNEYKRGLNEKKINLDDDFIKFVRFSQYLLATTSVGIVGMITNNVYLDGLTHRRMRQSLLDDFSTLRFLNLHGDQRKKETTPQGARDENVFDIMQGVAIAIFARQGKKESTTLVEYSDIWGSRTYKYTSLEATQQPIAFNSVTPRPPNFFFVARLGDVTPRETEYLRWWKFSDICSGISGIETKRDHFALDLDLTVLQRRIDDFVYGRYTDAQRKAKFDLRDNEWVVADAVQALRADHSWKRKFFPCLYRPFDKVWIIYEGVILARDRGALMAGMTQPNIAIVAGRQSKEPFAILATDCVCTHKIVTVYDRTFLFPLYLYPTDLDSRASLLGLGSKKANISNAFIDDCSRKLRLRWNTVGVGNLKDNFGPENVFHYIYAVFHSPSYRKLYEEFLKIDFPRVPLTTNLNLFSALSKLGGELIALHLLQSPKLDKPFTSYMGPTSPEIQRITYSHETVWIDNSRTQGFRGVPEGVWNFQMGYQVCEKWLKDRKDRTLSRDEISHYQKIVVALSETIRLMAEIDKVIDAHGGWPGAFTVADK